MRFHHLSCGAQLRWVAISLAVTAALAHAQGVQPAPGGYAPPGQGQGGGYGPPSQGQGGYAPPGQGQGQGAQSLDALMAWERSDMGVAPPKSLYAGPMHGPTPNQIPGGQVITTKGLVGLVQGQQGVNALVFDVLGGQQQLPNAIAAVPAAQSGSFNDPVQQRFGQMLQQVTRGNREVPLVFYCQGPQCWMSYNASLRAINLGYRNVLWYRGGVEAWQRAGLPLSRAQPAPAQYGAPQAGSLAPQQGGGYGPPGGSQGPQGGYGPQGGQTPQGGYGPPGGYDPQRPPAQPQR